DFKQKEKQIGTELKEALYDTTNKESMMVGCPLCKEGTLMTKKGKFGRFLACNKYPDCSYTVSLPKLGKIKPTEKKCEACGHEMLSIQQAKKAPQFVCINSACPTKKEPEKAVEADGKPCPTCKEGVLKLRKSLYGSFLGCSRYPKCKHTEKI